MPDARAQPAADPAADAVCEECGGTGYTLTEEGARPCACARERHAGLRLRRAKIPPRFAGKSLEKFDVSPGARHREIRAVAERYIASFSARTSDPAQMSSNGLLLIGGVGSGKTHIAVAVLRGAIARGFTGRYSNTVDLLDDLRASYERNSPQAGWQILEEVEMADLLVLDDLGAEAPTGWVLDRLYQIINRRYEDNRPTIVTTNLEMSELVEQIGPRITSRLAEMCMEVRFPDLDWRHKMMRESSH